ncbi:MAG: hypothetical protein H6712_30970, partial [Myxococcales bacterium]|nr:hypothetical protein [Myxococcales bacterium]
MTRRSIGLLTPSLLSLALATACGGKDPQSDDTGMGGTEGTGTSADESSDGTMGMDDDSGDPPLSCGDGVLDEGEECDGADFGGLSCADFGGDAGQLACSACQIDSSGCSLRPATHFGDGSSWALPDGGDALDGFYALAGFEWEVGDQSWSTTDLTGDGRPDLIITNIDGMPILGGGDPYWWIYPNTGDGFGER